MVWEADNTQTGLPTAVLQQVDEMFGRSSVPASGGHRDIDPISGKTLEQKLHDAAAHGQALINSAGGVITFRPSREVAAQSADLARLLAKLEGPGATEADLAAANLAEAKLYEAELKPKEPEPAPTATDERNRDGHVLAGITELLFAMGASPMREEGNGLKLPLIVPNLAQREETLMLG